MAAIQVKNVPEDLHAELRARAEAEGLTLSAYLLELIRKDLRKPRFRAWVDSLQDLPDADLPIATSGAEIIAEVRAEREAELLDRHTRRET